MALLRSAASWHKGGCTSTYRTRLRSLVAHKRTAPAAQPEVDASGGQQSGADTTATSATDGAVAEDFGDADCRYDPQNEAADDDAAADAIEETAAIDGDKSEQVGDGDGGGEEETEEEDEIAIEYAEELLEEDVPEEGLPAVAQQLIATQNVQGVPVPYPKPKWLQWSFTGAGAFLLTTFAWSVYKVWYRSRTKKAKKRKTVQRNRDAIESIERIISEQGRDKLSKLTAFTIRFRTGFSSREVFRKYLRYVLNERQFDDNTVQNLIAVKNAFGVSNPSVKAEMAEAAKRTANKVGQLILSPQGMTTRGLQRKALGKALFAKMLHLSEMEEFAGFEEDSNEMVGTLMREFGARERDLRELRGQWEEAMKHAEEDNSILNDSEDEELAQSSPPDTAEVAAADWPRGSAEHAAQSNDTAQEVPTSKTAESNAAESTSMETEGVSETHADASTDFDAEDGVIDVETKDSTASNPTEDESKRQSKEGRRESR